MLPHMSNTALTAPVDVVEFWKSAGPEKWFAKSDSFDAYFKARFLDAHYAAARRELDDWMNTADGALALIILLDQLPRNTFRGTAHMFATDPLALVLAYQAIEKGLHHQVEAELAPFILMPLMHSESIEDQEKLISLLDPVKQANTLHHAIVHRDIIAKFGRFPHRNQCLGRITTPEEQAFLDDGGFSG